MDTRSLMEQILSNDNLNAAYLQVVRNKGAAGVDGMTVEAVFPPVSAGDSFFVRPPWAGSNG